MNTKDLDASEQAARTVIDTLKAHNAPFACMRLVIAVLLDVDANLRGISLHEAATKALAVAVVIKARRGAD